MGNKTADIIMMILTGGTRTGQRYPYISKDANNIESLRKIIDLTNEAKSAKAS